MSKQKMVDGFIVHPYETGSGMYHASYGNHNKTVRNFKNLTEAKKYLSSKGVMEADYDSPEGVRLIKTTSNLRPIGYKRKPSFNFNYGLPQAPKGFRF